MGSRRVFGSWTFYPDRRSGWGMAGRLGLLGAAVVIMLAVAGSGLARTTASDLTGTWHCCGAGGAAAQDFVITSGKGSLAGKAQLPGGQVFATITGSVSGKSVTIITTYNSFAPGYVAPFVGTLSADDGTITGTWTSNRGQAGTFTATRNVKKPSLTVAVSAAKKVAVGKQLSVKVTVTAGAVDLANVDLGKGLSSSSDAASVLTSPAGLSGFALAAKASRSFTFDVKGVKDGDATLTAAATATGKGSGPLRGKGSATLTVGTDLSVDWKMPHRLFPDNSDWGGDLGLPPPQYVSPTDWQVDLFLTEGGKRSCPAGVTFDWAVKGTGKTIKLDSHRCSATAKVPDLATYSVIAKALKNGKPTGTEAKNAKVVVRDWLIVGMGDSNGSGQGNPPYINARCDRSLASYQYQTALYVENHDPHTSVTFVFDSCSGARSDQLWKNTYEGQEPSGGVLLPPQIDQVRGVIRKRKPDALIMSIGINDLYFGSIMSFCATYNITGTAFTDHTCEATHVNVKKDALGYTVGYSESADFADPTLATLTSQRLQVLPSRLASLAQDLRAVGAKHTFASHYPDFTTDEKGQVCSDKKGPFPKLSSAVWSWLRGTGDSLNAAVSGASQFGWVPIDGVAAGFVGHGYCSTDSWFDTPTKSQWEQSNRNGSFHALRQGAAITFARTRVKVCEKLYGNSACDGDAPASK